VLESKPEARIFRFGVFEFDPDSLELRKAGRIEARIRDQAGQILVMLLERSREVVTREELRQRLWPSDTFVDFDHGLNTAINQLRGALGDTAADSRFIQTIPRRGYRFLAPVETLNGGITALPVPPTSQGEKRSENHVERAGIEARPQPAVRTLLLSDPADLPAASHKTVRILFSLIQTIYLSFYVISLARLSFLGEILTIRADLARVVFVLVIVTAAVGIPTRLYLLSAVAFNYRGLNSKFQKLFPFLLILDELWALAPFLALQVISPGLALAATAALLYLPFSQRSLLLMGSTPQAD
jgi:cholera toxin transcriptional activator